jgi:hypothetical protein
MGAPHDSYFDAWGGSTTIRPDVGVIFVPQSNTQSAPPGMVWLTETPTISETRVHLAKWGPDRLLAFWAESDGTSVQNSAEVSWVTAEPDIVADDVSGYHVELVHVGTDGGGATWVTS